MTSPTTATVTGTITPNGAATQYRFYCECAGPGEIYSAEMTLPAGSSATTVTWSIPDLTPGRSSQVTLTATNSAGQASPAPVTFTTPLLPALSVTLHGVRPYTTFAGLEFITATISGGSHSAGQTGELQVAYPPSTTFRTVATASADASGTLTWESSRQDGGLTHNARVRVHLTGCIDSGEEAGCMNQPSDSASFAEQVLPSAYLTPSSPDARHTSVELEFGLPTPASRRGSAFFYTRLGTHGPFQLVRRVTLRPDAPLGPGLDAQLTFAQPYTWLSNRVFAACVRTPLGADMGAAFRFSACGGRRLAGPGPLGSSWMGPATDVGQPLNDPRFGLWLR